MAAEADSKTKDKEALPELEGEITFEHKFFG